VQGRAFSQNQSSMRHRTHPSQTTRRMGHSLSWLCQRDQRPDRPSFSPTSKK
jgi:hypothetical protein